MAGDSSWGLVGHERAIEALRRGLRGGRALHAYLIVGPARVGKTALAEKLARALICAGEDPPCEQCPVCLRGRRGSHVDINVIELEAAPPADAEEEGRASPAGPKNIKLRQVIALQREMALAPHEGRRKVCVIRGAEHLSIEAGNSLLKALEEPPAHAVFVLTSPDTGALLPTIVSRCQVVRLRPIAARLIVDHLRRRFDLDAARAELLARLSSGRIGWALAAVEDPACLAEREEALDRLEALAKAGLGERIAMAEAMAGAFKRDRAAVQGMLQQWTGWWRDVLLVGSGLREMVTNLDRVQALDRQAQEHPVSQAYRLLTRIETARVQLDQNVNSRLALEALLLSMPAARAG